MKKQSKHEAKRVTSNAFHCHHRKIVINCAFNKHASKYDKKMLFLERVHIMHDSTQSAVAQAQNHEARDTYTVIREWMFPIPLAASSNHSACSAQNTQDTRFETIHEYVSPNFLYPNDCE